MTQLTHYRGSLLGLATGDALGTPIEFVPSGTFVPPGTFVPLDDIVGGGPFDLEAGRWTDDTSLALCLADSLIEKHGFDPVDQLERYLKWYREGYMSSTGVCFDIGNTTLTALSKFEETHEPYCGPTHHRSASNGSLMRLAPVPLFFAQKPEEAIEMSGNSSRTTHGNTACVDACRYYGGLIAGAVTGLKKEELLSERYSPIPEYWEKHPLTPEIDEVASGSFKLREPPEIRGTGHVTRALEAALWAFHNSDSFKEGCLLAVNLGDDADTTGAIYGQLAGAYYGEEGIPGEWRAKLAMRELIERFGQRLYELS